MKESERMLRYCFLFFCLSVIIRNVNGKKYLVKTGEKVKYNENEQKKTKDDSAYEKGEGHSNFILLGKPSN